MLELRIFLGQALSSQPPWYMGGGEGSCLSGGRFENTACGQEAGVPSLPQGVVDGLSGPCLCFPFSRHRAVVFYSLSAMRPGC